MADVVIKKPDLNADKIEKNIALVDTWIHDTADKINYFMSHVGIENTDGGVANSAELARLLVLINSKQDRIRFDKRPTQGSNAAVTSGGVYDAIAAISAGTDIRSPFVVKNGMVHIRYRRKIDG